MGSDAKVMKKIELKEQKRDKKYGEIWAEARSGAKRPTRTKDGARANMARHRNQILMTGSPPCRRRRGQNIDDGTFTTGIFFRAGMVLHRRGGRRI